jgi:RNA polymerase sigma-70 factor (ECF subfamily)
VYGALRRFGLEADEADEVAQLVFLRAWRGLGGFQERARLSTWLYRIAFNEAQRRLSRRPPGRGPEARALEHEFEAMLEAALAELPPEWRAAVVLRDIAGLSTEEAAGVVGLGQAAFKSRLHRGRMQLRARLEPYLSPGGLSPE